MSRSEGRLHLAKLALCEEQLASLHDQMARVTAERARILREMAGGEPVDFGTGRRLPTHKEPEIPEPSEIDRARARALLKSRTIRRKVRP